MFDGEGEWLFLGGEVGRSGTDRRHKLQIEIIFVVKIRDICSTGSKTLRMWKKSSQSTRQSLINSIFANNYSPSSDVCDVWRTLFGGHRWQWGLLWLTLVKHTSHSEKGTAGADVSITCTNKHRCKHKYAPWINTNTGHRSFFPISSFDNPLLNCPSSVAWGFDNSLCLSFERNWKWSTSPAF